MYLIKNNSYYYNKKIKKSSGMEEKIRPLNVLSLHVNHNLSEIRRLFNPQTERMGNSS